MKLRIVHTALDMAFKPAIALSGCSLVESPGVVTESA
jgi:hypothetical protein